MSLPLTLTTTLKSHFTNEGTCVKGLRDMSKAAQPAWPTAETGIHTFGFQGQVLPSLSHRRENEKTIITSEIGLRKLLR